MRPPRNFESRNPALSRQVQDLEDEIGVDPPAPQPASA